MYCTVLFVPTCHIWVIENFNWKKIQNFATHFYEIDALVACRDLFLILWFWKASHAAAKSRVWCTRYLIYGIQHRTFTGKFPTLQLHSQKIRDKHVQAFLDFSGFNFSGFEPNAVYNSILFSSPLVLLSNQKIHKITVCQLFNPIRKIDEFFKVWRKM